MFDHAVAEHQVEGPIAKLLDIARVTLDDMERVMPQARGLKDFELAQGQGAGQVQERNFEGYRDTLPYPRAATKIEHFCPRLDFEDFNELSHPAPSKKRRNTWKELEERFNPTAAFLPRGSVCDGLSVTILFRQFHIRLHRFPGRPPPPKKKIDRHGARFMARKIYGTPLDGSPAARHRR